ncbi:MAG: kelch repeat-containing protein [Thermoplasmata archaeon]
MHELSVHTLVRARARKLTFAGAALVVAIVALEVLSLCAVGTATAAPPPVATASGSSGLVAAQQSLASGEKPSAVTVSPSARVDAVMTYDTKDGYVLLFGGANGSGLLHDSWKFAAGTWTPLYPAVAPPGQAWLTMTYDAKNGYVVLLDGLQTWKFVGGVWSQLSPKRSPTQLIGASMAYDAKDGYVVLFGGFNGTTYSSATWKFVGGQWTKLSLAVRPSARTYVTLAYDAADSAIVLFGGCHTAAPCTSGYFLADTWEFSGGTWTEIVTTPHPSARAGYMMTYDITDGYILLFGGCDQSNCSTPFADTWTFSGGKWTHQIPSPHPEARVLGLMAYDTKSKYAVLFGGVGTAKVYSDTWKYSAGAWKKL